jgi:LysM repeat protein
MIRIDNNNSVNSANNSGYSVKSGDTLSAIAQQHGVSLSDLLKANPQISNPNLIHAGQEIHIPGSGGSRPTGSLAGLSVSKGSSPSDRPASLQSAAKASNTATSANLPQPYAKYQNDIMAASKKYGIPPQIITGVMSRETNGQNEIGDGGHGRGLMQIDDRSHGAWLASHDNGLDPASNIDYGTSILKSNLDYFHGDMTKALAAYNAGPGNVDAAVSRGLSPDAYTTGGNYASDVLNRAQGFAKYFSGGGGGSVSSNSNSGNDGGNSAPAARSNPNSVSSVKKPSSAGSYTVKSGDTMSAIAARNGMSLSSLERANPQIANPNMIYAGQKLNMPGGSSSGASASRGGGSYRVQSGDTMSAIAARNGVSLSSLERANPQIANPNMIYAGQMMNMPGGGGSSSGGGSSASRTSGSAPSHGDTTSGGSSSALNAAKSILGMNIAQAKYSGPLAQYLDKWPGNNVCCANFVSAALQKAGQINSSEHNDSVQGLANNLRNDSRWSSTSLANAKPGDVVCFNVPGEGPMSHVEMFEGWKNGQPQFIGSNNVNADGTQRVSEGSVGYPIGAVFHFNG